MLTHLLAAALLSVAPPTDTTATGRSGVLWTEETYATMRQLYASRTAPEGGVEFAACLRARHEDGAWIVTEVHIPPQAATDNSVEADCTGYEGTAHSHPLWEGRRFCSPSLDDHAMFWRGPHQFLVIWCDLESFTFRTRDGGIGDKDVTPARGAPGPAGPYLAPSRPILVSHRGPHLDH